MPRAVDPNEYDNDPHDRLFGTSYAGHGRDKAGTCIVLLLGVALLACAALSVVALHLASEVREVNNRVTTLENLQAHSGNVTAVFVSPRLTC